MTEYVSLKALPGWKPQRQGPDGDLYRRPDPANPFLCGPKGTGEHPPAPGGFLVVLFIGFGGPLPGGIPADGGKRSRGKGR